MIGIPYAQLLVRYHSGASFGMAREER